MGRRPKFLWALSLHCTHQLSRLLDSSLRQALGGVTVGRRSAAEIARRGAAACRQPWRRQKAHGVAMPLNKQASGDHLESESYLKTSKHAGYRVGSAKFRYCNSSSWMRASAAELSTASTPSEIPRTASRSKILIFCAPGAIRGASICRRSAAARYTLPHANMKAIDALVHRIFGTALASLV